LKKSYNIKGNPTFILANKNAETLYRWWGYTKENFFKEMGTGFADLSTIVEKKKRYTDTPDIGTAKTLAIYYNTLNDNEKAVKYYSDAAKYDPENDYDFEIYEIYLSGHRRKIYTIDQLTSAADKALVSKNIATQSRAQIYAQMSSLVNSYESSDIMLNYVKNGHEFISEHDNITSKWVLNSIRIAHALYIDKDDKKAVELKKGTFDEGWYDNTGDLNNFSWWCFENKINLEEAEKLGRRGIKLAAAGHNKAMILDTVAEIVNLRGNPEEAVALMEEAMKEDPESAYYKKQIEKFKAGANKE
jgi:tetratricopeptide (TPR) repeat protein